MLPGPPHLTCRQPSTRRRLHLSGPSSSSPPHHPPRLAALCSPPCVLRARLSHRMPANPLPSFPLALLFLWRAAALCPRLRCMPAPCVAAAAPALVPVRLCLPLEKRFFLRRALPRPLVAPPARLGPAICNTACLPQQRSGNGEAGGGVGAGGGGGGGGPRHGRGASGGEAGARGAYSRSPATPPTPHPPTHASGHQRYAAGHGSAIARVLLAVKPPQQVVLVGNAGCKEAPRCRAKPQRAQRVDQQQLRAHCPQHPPGVAWVPQPSVHAARHQAGLGAPAGLDEVGEVVGGGDLRGGQRRRRGSGRIREAQSSATAGVSVAQPCTPLLCVNTWTLLCRLAAKPQPSVPVGQCSTPLANPTTHHGSLPQQLAAHDCRHAQCRHK